MENKKQLEYRSGKHVGDSQTISQDGSTQGLFAL